MELNYELIKILIAGILFSTMIFMNQKNRWIMALIITGFLMLMGAGVI